jgi:hypothetical protein
MEIKKLFCVTFTNQEDWDSPVILHVRATDRDSALKIALNKIEFTEEEADTMTEEGLNDYLVIEVDDIIEG